MTFDDYETERAKSDVYPRVHGEYDIELEGSTDLAGKAVRTQLLPVYPGLAISGEVGEFNEKVKKAWRDRRPLDQRLCALELGDILWYISAAARDLGYTLEQVAQMNIDKLASRRARNVVHGSGDER